MSTERERIRTVLKREKPDRIPWATRLDIWYQSHRRSGTLPAEYRELEEMAVYDALNIGCQSYAPLTKVLLKGVEVRVEFNGEQINRLSSPAISFPVCYELVPLEHAGRTVINFVTPAGTSRALFKTTDKILESFATPYLEKHLIEEDADFGVVEWILDHSQVIPDHESFLTREEEIGDRGLTVGMLGRIPFQRLLLDFLGEERCFYLMFDNPSRFKSLLDRLSEIDVENLRLGLNSPAFMLEYGDNFDGEITNPNLFAEYCLPHLQQASEKVSSSGRVLGSHMDGDMRNLIDLIPETGLDVVESFSPAPLSSLSFDDAWQAWKSRVIPWGIIPSPLFDELSPTQNFERAVTEMVQTIASEGLAILCIADQALRPTLPDRILLAGDLIEEYGRY